MPSRIRLATLSLIFALCGLVLALIALDGAVIQAQRSPAGSPRVGLGPVLHDSPCDQPNIALHKATSASSCQRSYWRSDLAVDGISRTGDSRWSSDFVDDAWIAVDLGSIATVECVVLDWQDAYGEEYTVDLSDDGSSWTSVVTVTGGDGMTDTLPLESPASARYVRMHGTQRGTQWGYSLWEFQVRGSGGVSPNPTPLPTLIPGANIAEGKPAYASSYDQAQWAPRFAVDGNRQWGSNSRWTSILWGETAWISVDLGAVATMDRLHLFWEDAYAAGFKILLSDDGVNWTTVYETGENRFDMCQTEKTNVIPFDPPLTGRYVRMLGCERCTFELGQQFGYSLYELEVYGSGDDPGVTPTPTPGELSGDWMLLWEDEFDGSGNVGPNGLDEDNWTIETDVCVNSEQQVYTTDLANVRVEDGVLILEARDEEPGSQECRPCPAQVPRFTSGRIISKDKQEEAYGRFEARMRLPVAEGLWPAFWLLGANIDDEGPGCQLCGHCGTIGWPLCGELDIMENIGYDDWYSVALHGPGYSGEANVGQIITGDWSLADWHIYSVDWNPLQIEWSIDATPVFSVTREALEAQRGQWVFDHPFFVVLNLALGGLYPYGWNHQQPGDGACFGLPAETIDLLPFHLEVDWVHVYGQRETSYVPWVAKDEP